MAPNQTLDEFKDIFSYNLTKLMDRKGKTVADVAADLGYPYMTVSDWTKGKKMPRMDKIEVLANYFDISRSELIEKQTKKAPTSEGEGEDVAELLEYYRTRPELKILFSVTKDASPESIRRAAAIVEALEKEEQGEG